MGLKHPGRSSQRGLAGEGTPSSREPASRHPAKDVVPSILAWSTKVEESDIVPTRLQAAPRDRSGPPKRPSSSTGSRRGTSRTGRVSLHEAEGEVGRRRRQHRRVGRGRLGGRWGQRQITRRAESGKDDEEPPASTLLESGLRDWERLYCEGSGFREMSNREGLWFR